MIPVIYLHIALAFIAALLICFAATPIVRMFANRIGAVDVPKDETRMHDHPMPLLGGLAIFLGFVFAVVLFADVTKQVQGILLGAVVVVIMGTIDDIMPLKWYVKLVAQIFAALIPVYHGVLIHAVSNPLVFSANEYLTFGNVLSVVLTVGWIIGMTNAVNLIDGLDGLAAGVSCISSVTVLVIALVVSDLNVAIIVAALAGSCLGFLPHNFNPAKIIMGDTGALFLGYMLATISITGLFKFFTIISFAVPFLVVGLPLFDTIFAFTRRILTGHHPMHRDRGHFHHRLIDMGLTQKQAVAVLYAISIVLGFSAVVITTKGEIRAIIFIFAVLIACAVAYLLLRLRASTSENGKSSGGNNDDKEDGK